MNTREQAEKAFRKWRQEYCGLPLGAEACIDFALAFHEQQTEELRAEFLEALAASARIAERLAEEKHPLEIALNETRAKLTEANRVLAQVGRIAQDNTDDGYTWAQSALRRIADIAELSGGKERER